jgi:hypothetical protein
MEAIVICFKVLDQYASIETTENNKNRKGGRSPGQDSNPGLPH